MTMNYSLDPTRAREADQRGGYITEIGAYLGKFARAEQVTAASGTRGVSFTFTADDGRRCDVSLYTLRADGTQLPGYGALMSLMTCLGLREIKAQPGRIKRWDRDQQVEVQADATLYPELMNKPVGVFLETEEFAKKDGTVGRSMRIAGFFQAGTQLVASEILDRATVAERFDRILAGLRHKPLKTGKRPAAVHDSGSLSDIDSDIPF